MSLPLVQSSSRSVCFGYCQIDSRGSSMGRFITCLENPSLDYLVLKKFYFVLSFLSQIS